MSTIPPLVNNETEVASFRQLAENIDLNFEHKQIIAVTSSQKGEGKSTIAANLAFTYAKEGFQTLLIDANLTSPMQDTIFDLQNYKGVSTYLEEESPLLQRFTLPSGYIRTLDLLTSGPHLAKAQNYRQNLEQLLEEAKKYYRRIIIDTSALDVSDLSLEFIQESELTLFIARKKYSEQKEVQRAFKKLKRCDIPIAIVENEFKS
ncbi:tyrosine-protein kinase family protein [Catellicoccus marimammalium]|uniref:Capsular polysaccharide biosynthesis protein n=1 Tax=Catellicoccus marimammalium M35/04/3 TaxID=1234409 RepID=K8ZNT9_9ENTE|nr:CpsD/CapB family tyrosine-protein kinase [Catellicoccus marimammalium]EKU27261.1 capsular polysaccharide biosynthesis protein [Catellicoccus marimammalium M35/04/3]